MTLPTEPIGSIPRPLSLLQAVEESGKDKERLDRLYKAATRDTIARLAATGSAVITNGEQRKYPNSWTYPVHALPNTAPDGFKIPFAAGHVRRMPRLTSGPFRYQQRADAYVEAALNISNTPVKQAVISPSARSLMYPAEQIPDDTRAAFSDDLVDEHVAEVSACLSKGAHKVQIDFTEGRMAAQLDPSGELLSSFVHLNNLALTRFSFEVRRQIGIHTCPGAVCHATQNADGRYADLLPRLFQIKAGNFYIALKGEVNRTRVFKIMREYMKPWDRIFVGVINPIDPHVETPEVVRDCVLDAAKYIPISQFSTTDDCGFSPFCDDTMTTRHSAFAKIQARVQDTELGAKILGGT